MTQKWEISKEFGFDYGHRVWSQKLNTDYSIDCKTVCRHVHGHRGQVHIHLSSTELTNGMVSDFKHLNWAKQFIDDCIDHKFILDLHDPWFARIINAEQVFDPLSSELTYLHPNPPLESSSEKDLIIIPVFVPGTTHLVGWVVDVCQLSGPEQEFFEGFFLVDFLPTSENLSKWLFDSIDAKMKLINVKTSKIEWWETPKSCSTYTGE